MNRSEARLFTAALGGWSTRLCAVLLAVSAHTAHAGINVWTSHGPEGGSIVALAIDPTTPSTLYAGTATGGVFKSTDSGGSWSPAHTGLPDTTVLALAIAPTTPSTLYAGTYGGVFDIEQVSIDPTAPVRLMDYFYPVQTGATWLYQGPDQLGKPHGDPHNTTHTRIRMANTNYPLTLYNPTAYIQNVLVLDEDYGYLSGTTFVPTDNWKEYWSIANGLATYGDDAPAESPDDDPESLRVSMTPFPVDMTVGQSETRQGRVYDGGLYDGGTGDFLGNASITVQVIERTSVTVPAGTFPDCVQLRFTLTLGDSTQVHDEWWALGVGKVRNLHISGYDPDESSDEYWQQLISYTIPGAPTPTPSPTVTRVPTSTPTPTATATQLHPTATQLHPTATPSPVTLSGTIVYTGTHGPVSSTRRILVFLTDTPSLSSETTLFLKAGVTTNPGTFRFDVPAAGNYYLFYSLDEHDDGDLNVGTPFGVYHSRCAFPADPIAAPQSNVQLELGDTCFPPGIAGNMTYTGNLGSVSPGKRLCLEAFTDPELLTNGWWGPPCGTNEENNSEGYDMPTFDTRTYYLRAFLDVNGNSAFDAGEPFQIYSNKGVPPGDPVVASTTQTNINFTFGDENVMPGTCVGDCDGTGSLDKYTINNHYLYPDLITLGSIALGNAQPSKCPHGVPSGAQVNVALIIQAVNNALNGCAGVNITGINLDDYMFPMGDQSFATFQYTKAPPGQLNFIGAPSFTVNVTRGNYGGYSNIYRMGDYYFPDYHEGIKTLYLNADKNNLYLYGNENGFFTSPHVIPASQPLDTVIEQPSGDPNTPWYFKNIGTLTVPAGTFKNVVVELDLDRTFGGPNAGNYLFGISVPDAGVTHATFYAKGVGEIENRDFDENGDIPSIYVLETYSVNKK